MAWRKAGWEVINLPAGLRMASYRNVSVMHRQDLSRKI
jgi:hypothetical protein